MPRDLETICLKCLQKEPGKRYASAAALAEDLRRFRRGEPILARPVGGGARGQVGAGNPVLAGMTAGVAPALMSGTGVSDLLRNRSLAAGDQRSGPRDGREEERGGRRRQGTGLGNRQRVLDPLGGRPEAIAR